MGGGTLSSWELGALLGLQLRPATGSLPVYIPDHQPDRLLQSGTRKSYVERPF